jgi:hypothetical protein
MSLGAMILLFLPVFLVLELVSAAPGRMDLGMVARHGVRNFGRHLVILIVVCVGLHLFTEFMIDRAPLW